MNDSIWRKIARVKAVSTRFQPYGNVLQLILLFKLAGLNWWYLLIPIIIWIAYWFETKHGIYGEMDVSWGRSKDWQAFLKRFEQVERRINQHLS